MSAGRGVLASELRHLRVERNPLLQQRRRLVAERLLLRVVKWQCEGSLPVLGGQGVRGQRLVRKGSGLRSRGRQNGATRVADSVGRVEERVLNRGNVGVRDGLDVRDLGVLCL